MRIVIATVASATLALCFATPAAALLPSTGITVGVTGGTLGVGPEASYKINPLLSVRASATFLAFSHNANVGNYRYDGHAKLNNWGGTIDLHPFANGFRLSAGARATSHNKIRFHGQARQNQTYGNVTYTPEQAGTLSGEIRSNSVSPLVTVGYAKTTLSGFTFGIDGGVMFHGHPDVRNVSATGQLATNPLAQSGRADAIQRLSDKVDGYAYYPVVQLSIGYHF